METKEFTVATPTDFSAVIVRLMTQKAPRSGAYCICLTGQLGAGKTTFTQQLAAHLGVTEPVTSPTFGIMKSYDLADHPNYDQLVHIDAYRIEDISEAGPLRLTEIFAEARTLICLEWPEMIAEILPTECVNMTIEIGEGEERRVVVRD